MADLSVNRCLPSPDFSDLQRLLSGDPGSEVVRGVVRRLTDETNWEVHLGANLKAGGYRRFEVVPDSMMFIDLIRKGGTFSSVVDIFPTLPLFDGKKVSKFVKLDTLRLEQKPGNPLEVAANLFVFGGETVVDITPEVMKFIGIEPETWQGPLSGIFQTLLQRLAEMGPEALRKAKEMDPVDWATLRFVACANCPDNEPLPPLGNISKIKFNWDEFPIGKSLLLKGLRAVTEFHPVPETHGFRLVSSEVGELGVKSVEYLKEGCPTSTITNTRITDLVLNLAPKDPKNMTAGLTDMYLVGGSFSIHSGGAVIAGIDVAPFEYDRGAAHVTLYDGEPNGDIKGRVTLTQFSADSGLVSLTPNFSSSVRGGSLQDVVVSFEVKAGRLSYWNITARPKVRQFNVVASLDSVAPSASLLMSGLECGNVTIGQGAPTDLATLVVGACHVDESTVSWGKEFSFSSTGDFDLDAQFNLPTFGLTPVSADLFWQGALLMNRRDRMIGNARFNLTPEKIGYDLRSDGAYRIAGTLDRQTLDGPLTLSYRTKKNGEVVSVSMQVALETPTSGGFLGTVQLQELKGRLTEDFYPNLKVVTVPKKNVVKIPKGTPIVIPVNGFKTEFEFNPKTAQFELRWRPSVTQRARFIVPNLVWGGTPFKNAEVEISTFGDQGEVKVVLDANEGIARLEVSKDSQGRVLPIVFHVVASDGKTVYRLGLRASASSLSGGLKSDLSEGAFDLVDMRVDHELTEKGGLDRFLSLDADFESKISKYKDEIKKYVSVTEKGGGRLRLRARVKEGRLVWESVYQADERRRSVGTEGKEFYEEEAFPEYRSTDTGPRDPKKIQVIP